MIARAGEGLGGKLLAEVLRERTRKSVLRWAEAVLVVTGSEG